MRENKIIIKHKKYGIEDVFIAVFGITSNEVYAIRRFLEKYNNMESWDTDYMWNDCESDTRLYNIIS